MGGHRGVAGFVASFILLAMGTAVAKDATWKDCELGARVPDRSIAACTRLLKRPSSRAHATAFHQRARAYGAKGRIDEAISDSTAGIRLDSKSAYLWQERGELYARQGKYEKAVSDFTEAIRKDTTPRAFRFQHRAEAYLSLGEPTRAIADFDEAIRLDPVARWFRFRGRGNALRDAGQYDRALADYETALNMEPTNALVLVDRGRASARIGRPEAARNDFDNALRLDPANAELRDAVELELAALPGQSAQSNVVTSHGTAPRLQRSPDGYISSRPTFDCGIAKSPLALLICLSGEEAARADWHSKIAYWARNFSLDAGARAAFWEDQDKWSRSLTQKCELSAPPFSRRQTACIIDAYNERTALYRSKLSGDALAESQMTPEQLSQIQQALITLGFFHGEADGEFGPMTRAAIRRYQEANNSKQNDFLSTAQSQALLEGRTARSVAGFSHAVRNSGTGAASPGTPSESSPPQRSPPIDTTAESAKDGDPSAQIEMGNRYESGQMVPKDDPLAVSWYRKAAEQGNAKAQYLLARMYFEGRGVAQDDAAAFEWYRKAAAQDNVGAEYALGRVYDYGRGTEKDGAKAVEWYQKAVAQGSQDAKDRLDERATILARLRSTRETIATRVAILLTELDRARVEESAARFAAANDQTSLIDLNALRLEADDVDRTFGVAAEFASVSEIAAKRIAVIEGELEQITSDAPVILRLESVIGAVKAARAGSDLRVLQSSLGELNGIFDRSRPQLDKLKFYHP